ncbi:MAG: transposase [Candidatus Marinimicrobia bacterium]|nr:transposase [Candidatus Neomarinimicrobiota bacterium]
MKQNDINIYPVRKAQRLKNYNYSRQGYYYITITLANDILLFGNIINGRINLNEIGKIVDKCWKIVPDHFSECMLDKYVIMPDHFHGIIRIVRNRHACSVHGHTYSVRRQDQLLPLIIGGFKSATSKLIHQLGFYEFKWHKSYYDRILRKDELNCKRKYISDNPLNFKKLL